MPEMRNDGAETQTTGELLPVTYEDLRRLAAAMMGRLAPGQTLQPTALVHEAYLRLARNREHGWEGRRHFFGAAAQAMRELLIEQARRKRSMKRGGAAQRVELDEEIPQIEPPVDDVLALDDALSHLQAESPRLAEIVKLRYFTGLSVEETAGVVGASMSTVHRDWRYARAWLVRRLGASGQGAGNAHG